jgi:hypothetical protein
LAFVCDVGRGPDVVLVGAEGADVVFWMGKVDVVSVGYKVVL